MKEISISLRNNKWNKVKIILLIINLVYLAISFYNDSIFFLFRNDFNRNAIGLYIVIKVGWVISIIVVEYFLFLFFWRKIACSRVYLVGFLINTSIYLLIFAMLFPGNWGGVADEFLVYWGAKNLWVWPQQGVFSGLIMIWQLMFYPAVWMPILIQLCVSSLMFSRIVGKLWNKKYYVTAIAVELTIFSFTSILFAYCPMRMWIFSVTFCALLAEIYFIWIDSVAQKGQIVYITMLLSFAVCIRTEAKAMLITIPAALSVVFIHCGCMGQLKKVLLKMIFVTILSSVSVGVVFNFFGGNAFKYNSLSAVSFICPLSVILTDTEADLEGMEEELDAIDKVFPISDITDSPSAVHFWNMKHWISDYENPSKAEVGKCIIASGEIIIRNLDIYFKSRMEMFEACMPRNSIHAYRTIEDIRIWHENNHSSSAELYHDYDYNNPLKKSVSRFLCGENQIPEFIRWIQYFFVIPITGLLFYTMYCLLGKGLAFSTIILTVWIQFILMFFLVPSAHCMYYLPFYLIGWMAMGYLFELMIKKIRGFYTK